MVGVTVRHGWGCDDERAQVRIEAEDYLDGVEVGSRVASRLHRDCIVIAS